jgi:DNA-binding CsgD family transcriptional regulator
MPVNNMSYFKINTICLLIFLQATSAIAQIINRPFVINYTKKIYQADNQNWSVTTGWDELVYIGNNQGLLEFDGANWNLYKMPGQMVVRSVAIGPDSLIYVGSFEEFGYWKKDEFGILHYTSLAESLDPGFFHNDEIWRIIPHDGKIYFQSFSSIYIYDGHSIRKLIPGQSFVLLSEARDRLFIHVVGKGLYTIVQDSLVLVAGSTILANDEVKVVLPYRDKAFLAGASFNGMYLFDDKTFVPWKTPVNSLLANSEVNNGILLKNRIVLGTIVNGLFFTDHMGRLLLNLNSSNFLQNNTILALCTDKKNNIWAGLDQGLAYIKLDTEIDFYTDPAGKSGSVYAAALKGNILWIGTNQGLLRYKYDSLAGYTEPLLIPGSQGQVWDLSEFDGELLCGHNNGTYSIQDNSMNLISEINGGRCIRKDFIGNTEVLVQSTYNEFVIYTRGRSGWVFSHVLKGFLEPVPNFEIDHLGYIWAAHESKGLFRIKPDKDIDSVLSVKYYGKAEGLPTERNIAVSKIENRIVFTTGQEVYTYDDLHDTIIPYDLVNNLTGEFRQSGQITPIGDNRYWFLQGNQAALFNINDLNVIKVYSYDFTSYDVSLGSIRAKTILLADSLHLICLENGFALLDERRIQHPAEPPKVIIRKIRAFTRTGEDIYLPLKTTGKKLDLNHRYRNLEFTFSSDNFSVYNQYSCKLLGLDEDWSGWSPRSVADYSRLPYGTFEFQVMAKNETTFPERITSYPVHISAPWYLSKVALILYGVLLISIFISLRIIFRKRLLKHTGKIEEEEKEKRKLEQMRAEQELIRLKNEKLQAEIAHKSVQLANFTLTVINRNELLINLKSEIERQKIEMGNRYPKYHFEKLVKLIDHNISSENDWKMFEFHFDQAHENFFRRLREVYPDLTPSDMRLCAYLRMNLTSKEIAPLLNITLRGVEVRRYRLRKRLKITTSENLINFLMSF